MKEFRDIINVYISKGSFYILDNGIVKKERSFIGGRYSIYSRERIK